MLRLVQISDTHLSRRRPFFQHNWELLIAILAESAPDLVVCTGDMSVDGADFEDELAFAAEQFRRIKTKVLFVPGNHDVGNSLPDVRGGETVITAARRGAYLRHFGPDFWIEDIGRDWRLVGLNSMLPGSGLPAEREQDEMLRRAVAGRGERKLFVFKHKPLYLAEPEDSVPTQGALYLEHRLRMRDLLADAGPVLVASGHIHDYKRARWENLRQIWAPSTAFTVDGSGRFRPRYGVRRLGYLEHALDGRRHRHAFVEPDSFINIDLGNWMRAPAGFHHRYESQMLLGLQLSGEQDRAGLRLAS